MRYRVRVLFACLVVGLFLGTPSNSVAAWLLVDVATDAEEPDAVGYAWMGDTRPEPDLLEADTGPPEPLEVDNLVPPGPPAIDPAGLLILQPQPLKLRTVRPFQAADVSKTGLFGRGKIRKSLFSRQRQQLSSRAGADVVLGKSARSRAATDAGSLLQKSPAVLGLGIQKRTPIITDTRIRGGRVGRLAANGSYWVPARIDLDTMLSKIDARLIESTVVIRGPYSAQHGPGFNGVDIDLLGSPRFDNGWETHASSGLDFKTNGEQWYARQTAWGGDQDWGFRVDYGHRTGNDYRSGNGTRVPSSYKSRTLDVAVGADLDDDTTLEFHYLRLDQTDVEFPGQAFDIDFLVTDAYELQFVRVDQEQYDRLEIEGWYNRTRFEGNAQSSGKRKQFPLLNAMNFRGFTDVDSTSTGFRSAVTWDDEAENQQLTAGVDMRHIRQELNEITSGRIGFNIFTDANSPIPRSQSTNPGLFAEYQAGDDQDVSLTAGARVDWQHANVTDDPAKLAALGTTNPQSSLADILGTDDFKRNDQLVSAFATLRWQLEDGWSMSVAGGHAQRPPTLTELYTAQTFLFLLQNGQNTATGDPELDPERLWQVDVGLELDRGPLRAGINGFHSWVNDYVTFENLNVFHGPPNGQVEQVSLQYVNTDLATLAGAEAHLELDLSDRLTPFATLSYIEGRDHDRNGSFATQRAQPGQPKQKVAGLPRGHFSGVDGGAKEPLPAIVPLESRVGVRWHPAGEQPPWGLELSARIIDNQNRVATSLLESASPGFTTWNLRGFWAATQKLSLVAGVENFTDKNFREHLDFRSPSGIRVFQPGINFYFGSELNY
jgi:iron complex outermembrane receptor protein